MIATSEAEKHTPIKLPSTAEEITVSSMTQTADHENGTDENDHELNGHAAHVSGSYEESDPTAEISPHGRYVKLDTRLGSGAYKDVWRAYDTIEGMEVAWNVVKLSRIPPGERKRIKIEVMLLRDLQHKNIIKYYNSWVDRGKEQIVFITEIMSAGSLKEYLRKHPIIRWNAVKRWCKQILHGIEFLHVNKIIHRDIKCDNIFINGATGDIRIGDLGLSTKISENRAAEDMRREITSAAMTCLGTPEFMAPELYEESYNEKVDIYAFGMTLLEMVTAFTPYHECTSAPQIYKKVTRGELPPELQRVKNSRAVAFIRKCLLKQEERPTAAELLTDDFLLPNELEDFEQVRDNIKDDEEEDELSLQNTADHELAVKTTQCDEDQDERIPSVHMDDSEGQRVPFRSSVPFSNVNIVNRVNAAPLQREIHLDMNDSALATPNNTDQKFFAEKSDCDRSSSRRGSFGRVRKVRGASGSSMNDLILLTDDSNHGADMESELTPDANFNYSAQIVGLSDQDDFLVFSLSLQSHQGVSEVEFLFDVIRDDAAAVIDEMKEDPTVADDLKRLKISTECILSAINPVIDLARGVASRLSSAGDVVLPLSTAVYDEVLLMTIEGMMTSNTFIWSKFEQYIPNLTCFDGLVQVARRRNVIIPRGKLGDENASGSDEFLTTLEHSLLLDESDDSFQEHVSKWKDVYYKHKKEYERKVDSLPHEREKIEELYRKEMERLVTRREDLNAQLKSMEEKFKERMQELETKKSALLEILGPDAARFGLNRDDENLGNRLSIHVDPSTVKNSTGVNNAMSATSMQQHGEPNSPPKEMLTVPTSPPQIASLGKVVVLASEPSGSHAEKQISPNSVLLEKHRS